MRISDWSSDVCSSDLSEYSRGRRRPIIAGEILRSNQLQLCVGFGKENSVTDIFSIFADPAVWAALTALVVMEVVLGIDNLIFISILSNKLPPHQQSKARRLGIGLALFLRDRKSTRLNSSH